MQIEAAERSTFGKRKPAGGFVFLHAWQLLAVWWCYREGHLQLRQLRVWLALHEMEARRCEIEAGRKPRFGLRELQGLVGGVGGEHLRRDLKRLESLGLAKGEASRIEFLNSVENLKVGDISGLLELLCSVENTRRRVPVPRRALRWMAAAASRVLAATVIGHALRLLYYRKGLVEPRGRCKASWVARVFGVDERGVRRARKKLVEVGLLHRAEEDTPRERVFENRWGRAFIWDLKWARSEVEAGLQCEELSAATSTEAPESAAVGGGGVEQIDTGLPPVSELSTTDLPGPESDRKPLRDSKNQKPRRGPAGASSSKEEEAPNLRDVVLEDLRDTSRLLALFHQATERGLVSGSDVGRLNFVGAAEHALAYGEKPPALFMHIVRRGLWKFITQDDEDAANVRLKRQLFGHGVPNREKRRYDPVTGELQSSDPVSFAELVSSMLGESFDPEQEVAR